MMKERIGAIIVGLIMLFSVMGFALSSSVVNNPEPEQGIEPIIKGELTSSDVLFILQNGKTIYRYYYANDQKSLDDKITLEIFVNSIKDYVVLNEIESNETSLEIVAVVNQEGKIISYNGEINNQDLFLKLCEVAAMKPKECFMYDI
ncbi:MAG: hypothetical protein ABIF08_03335 [Nanoarchaeota archaeon]